MSIYWSKNDVSIYLGDNRAVMRSMPENSVQCMVSSPPYWGVRSYMIPHSVYGGLASCAHQWGQQLSMHRGGPQGDSEVMEGRDRSAQDDTSDIDVGCFCMECGAWRGQLGLEPTPELYVEHLVECMAEAHRVLKPDGVFWMNLGDTFATGAYSVGESPGGGMQGEKWKDVDRHRDELRRNRNRGNATFAGHGKRTDEDESAQEAERHALYRSRQLRDGEHAGKNTAMVALGPMTQPNRMPIPGLKPKDLCLIPSMAALALRNWGWWLRSETIWHKLNPTPESALDRPTRAHEQLYLLTKSSHYYYDAKAIAEPVSGGSHPRGRGVNPKSKGKRLGDKQNESFAAAVRGEVEMRNKRSVWSVAAEPFYGKHYACVDESTDCLTIDGWKPYGDLKVGLLAAQFDMTSGRLSWAPIEALAIHEVRDEAMVSAKSRDVEMLLTTNHRTIIHRRHNDNRQWGPPTIIRADAIKKSHGLPVSAPWDDEGTSPVSGDWAELIGWYIAEGCEAQCEWAIEIYQSHSANPEKVQRIRSLLLAVGAEFSEETATRMWRGEPRTLGCFQVRGFAAAYLRQWAPGKGFHPTILQWSAPLLERCLAGLVDGDGHRRPDGRFAFIQRSRSTTDMAQGIGVRLGYATMSSWRSGDKGSFGAAAGYANRGSHILYFTKKRVISFRGNGGYGADISTRPYTGVVWCPKLPAGTWVARKNGRAFLTGNTMPTAVVVPCVKSGSRPGDMVGDPFGGAGTVSMVAWSLQRQACGIDLGADYCDIARERIEMAFLRGRHRALSRPRIVRAKADQQDLPLNSKETP